MAEHLRHTLTHWHTKVFLRKRTKDHIKSGRETFFRFVLPFASALMKWHGQSNEQFRFRRKHVNLKTVIAANVPLSSKEFSSRRWVAAVRQQCPWISHAYTTSSGVTFATTISATSEKPFGVVFADYLEPIARPLHQFRKSKRRVTLNRTCDTHTSINICPYTLCRSPFCTWLADDLWHTSKSHVNPAYSTLSNYSIRCIRHNRRRIIYPAVPMVASRHRPCEKPSPPTNKWDKCVRIPLVRSHQKPERSEMANCAPLHGDSNA